MTGAGGSVSDGSRDAESGAVEAEFEDAAPGEGTSTRATPHRTAPVAYGSCSTPSRVHSPAPANHPSGAGR